MAGGEGGEAPPLLPSVPLQPRAGAVAGEGGEVPLLSSPRKPRCAMTGDNTGRHLLRLPQQVAGRCGD